MTYTSLEKFTRILQDGYRGYSFSLKKWAVKEIFSLSIRQYCIERANNVITNGIKNPSQVSHLYPFVSGERVLPLRGKDMRFKIGTQKSTLLPYIQLSTVFQILSCDQAEFIQATRSAHGYTTGPESTLRIPVPSTLQPPYSDYFQVSMLSSVK